MSSVLDSTYAKGKCQKFTSPDFVETALDMALYKDMVVGKRVLEHSFGSGNFLKGIVLRYIKSGQSQGLSPDEISKKMSDDIVGIELDPFLFNRAIEELNHLTSEYGLPAVRWSLFNDDFLTCEFIHDFDFIIGNPPYLSYRDIGEENRKQIRQSFSSCKSGKFDYCYAFIEKSIGLLSTTGRLVQLVPSNIYKNVFAKDLRAMMLKHMSVIWEYPQKKIFGETLTSSSIFMYDNSDISDYFEYKNVTEEESFQVKRGDLSEKWVFHHEKCENHEAKKVKFGDHYNASIAVATLLNEAFIVVDQETVSRIEPRVIRPAASPSSLHRKKKEYIIFPYYYNEDTLYRYPYDEFEKEYPQAAKHLNRFRQKLDSRDHDKNAKWFEYGRSQALMHLNREKLLLSTVITSKVEVYYLDSDTIPYSGIYITAKDELYPLKHAKELLESEQFMTYVQGLGISISGKSKRITCKDINNFYYTEES